MKEDNKLIKEWLPLLTFGALVILIGINLTVISWGLHFVSAPSTLKVVIGVILLLQMVVVDYISVKQWFKFLDRIK